MILCGYADIIGGYVAKRYSFLGHVALWYATTGHLLMDEFFFHTLCRLAWGTCFGFVDAIAIEH